MRQMNKKILMIFAVLLVLVCQTAVNAAGIMNVTVVPSQPLNTDLITFNISGIASSSPSSVAYDLFSQNGTLLRLDLYINEGVHDSISYWNYSKQIQPLSVNNYNLEVRAFDNYDGSLDDTYNADFTITPEPSTIALLCFALPIFRTSQNGG